VSKTRLSVICPSCRACFCKLSLFPMRGKWNQAMREELDRQAAAQAHRAPGTSSNSRGDLTVLIVDDDEEIRLITEYRVQQMGYRTLSAANGDEALNIVEKSRPDIVLTDALMPKMDGRQLCRLIKVADASIKVILMTALYKSTRYRHEALGAFRVDAFLAKPMSFDQLRLALEKTSRKAA
jgi:CheY-like chemotaxis protein